MPVPSPFESLNLSVSPDVVKRVTERFVVQHAGEWVGKISTGRLVSYLHLWWPGVPGEDDQIHLWHPDPKVRRMWTVPWQTSRREAIVSDTAIAGFLYSRESDREAWTIEWSVHLPLLVISFCKLDDPNWLVDFFLATDRGKPWDVAAELAHRLVDYLGAVLPVSARQPDPNVVPSSASEPWRVISHPRNQEIAKLWYEGRTEGQIADFFGDDIAKHTVHNLILTLRGEYGEDVIPYHRSNKRGSPKSLTPS